MDLFGNESPDSTSFLGEIKAEHQASNCELIEINSEDESNNPEVINLSSDEEPEDIHEIVQIDSEDEISNHEQANISVKNEPSDSNYVKIHSDHQNGTLKTVKTELEDENSVSPQSMTHKCAIELVKEDKDGNVSVKTELQVDNSASSQSITHKLVNEDKDGNVETVDIKAEDHNLVSSEDMTHNSAEKPMECENDSKEFVNLQNPIDESDISNCEEPTTSSIQDSGIFELSIETDLLSTDPNLQCSRCHNFYSSKLYLEHHPCAADMEEDELNGTSPKLNKHHTPYSCVASDGLEISDSSDHTPNGINQSSPKFHSRQSDKKPFSCVECNKTFKNIKMLNKHTRLHYKSNPYECDDCGEEFTQLRLLKNHKSTEHESENLKCQFCSVQCENIQILRKHYQQIHEYQYKPYDCKQCGQAFNMKIQLKDHEKIHSAVKPYACAECAWDFKTKYELKQHQAKHSNYKPFTCEKCGKAFRLKQYLKQHYSCETACERYIFLNKNKKLKKSDEDEGSYFDCNQCDKSFKRKASLKLHLQLHSDLRQFICKVCGRGFKQFQGLYHHKKSHKTEKPYVCDLCGKGFEYEKSLKFHKLVVTHRNGSFD